MSIKQELGTPLEAILSATDPASTFEAARALGERGPDALPALLECLAELAAADREAPMWGLASALQWVLQGYLEAVAGERVKLDERPLNAAVDGLGGALARLQPGMESPAIKIATILGEELPRASAEFLEGPVGLPARARLLERCRQGLVTALAGGPAAAIGALTGLSQLAEYIGPAMIKPAVEKALAASADPKVTEVATWALAMIQDEPA